MASKVRTFLFTDLEGSTRGWMADEASMAAALDRHDAILRSAIERHEGTVLKHTGDGVVGVFVDPLRAVEAAVAAQLELRADPDGDRFLRARMGLHTGPCTERDGDFFGPTLNRTARIMTAGHGGQVLASSAVAGLVGDVVPLLDLGDHRLPDLLEPERLHQVVVDDAGAYPAVRSLDAFDHNLPHQRTRLIGREADVARVRELVASSGMVTLTGVGGVGKTRLALEVAARELPGRDGVVFVDLAPVADPAMVPGALASALRLPPGDTGADLAPVLRVLASRSMLVVLDNCEHLLDSCADLVEVMLDHCPSTTTLATSREPLGIDAERVWRVPSIVDRAAAIELFVERATAVRADFALDDATEMAVAAICQQLDGIPLAIELAAARVAHLSVPDIRDRLGERFRLLTGGRRRTRQRHQTLQAALDWSHDLLTEPERVVLRRTAVFSGGFTLPAAQHVVGDDAVPGRDVLDLVGSLVDRSLIVAQPEDAGAGRYSMLETVRLYGLDRLADAGEAELVRDRHAGWVKTWLELHPPIAWTMAPRTANIVAERDNVLAALDWAADRGDLAALGRLAATTFERLGTGAWVDDGGRFFGRADVELALDGEDRAAYLAASAWTANALGDFRRQLELAERAREADVGTPAWRAATVVLANATSVLDPARSAPLYDEVLSTIPADARDELAFVVRFSSDPALMTGDLEEGARRLEEAVRLGGVHDADLGFVQLVLGRTDRVRETVAALRHDEASPWPFRTSLLRGLLGAVEGRTAEAADDLVEAARLIERFPLRLIDHDVLIGFAALAHHEGDHRRAAELLAAVSVGPIWTRTPATYTVFLHYRRLVRPHLSAEEVAAIRAAARHTSVTELLTAEVARRSA